MMMSPADRRLAKLRIMAQVIGEAANADTVAARIAGVVRGATNDDVNQLVTDLRIESSNLMLDSLGLT